MDELRRQLSDILAHVRRLEALDAAGPHGGEAPADGLEGVRLRADEPGADPLHLPLRDLAPAFEQDLFVVPRLGAPAAAADGADAVP